ncbi:hypothetical protein ACS8Y6_08325 [Salinisphaera sp. RV14]|uniref:hypothetical protein n=1 Tax=unclassified Salinisphaera TaxID=2649847 RepID=UPI003F847C75
MTYRLLHIRMFRCASADNYFIRDNPYNLRIKPLLEQCRQPAEYFYPRITPMAQIFSRGGCKHFPRHAAHDKTSAQALRIPGL